MIFLIISAILGAAWRVWDGTGKLLPGGARVAACGVLTLIIAALAMQPYDPLSWLVVVIMAGSATWAMSRGMKNWEIPNLRQITHYWPAAVPAALAAVTTVSLLEPLIYVNLLWVAGLAHPVLSKLRGWLPHPTRWAEGVAGAIVIGGLALL